MAVGELRKIDVHPKHTRHWLWYMTAISFVTGALLASCLRTQNEWKGKLGIRVWRPEVIADALNQSREQVKQYQADLSLARDRVTELEKTLAEGGRDKELINEELQKYKMLMGLVPLEGPGVVVTINDSTLRSATTNPEDNEALIIHDRDLQQLVNELRASGAEAVSINGQRVVERTAIRCVGPVMQVNNQPIGNPFRVAAVGDPQTLRGGLQIPGGLADQLKELSFPLEIKVLPKVRVPAYTGPVELRIAHPVPETQGTVPPGKEEPQ